MMNVGYTEELENLDGELMKVPSGIQGLDEIMGGGLPQGRPTLVCGGPGSGKTLFGMEFLIRGATDLGEPGVVVSFEETERDLAKNVKSLGFDLNDLVRRGKLFIEYVYIERSEIEEAGAFNLDGLFVRLEDSVGSIGARRVLLDSLESLFGGIPNEAILRSEIRRLFRWLRDRGITAVVTAEKGEQSLTRYGLEEYISDCVLFLDHRVTDQIATRRLRVVKYRGSTHGTNEYPFLIDQGGMFVFPVTSIGLDYEASDERISTGIPRLDAMLGDRGYYRGSSILISGTAGTGKTSIAAHFAAATCRRGERCIYFAFEESPRQILRNMRSIGLDLEPLVDRGLLIFNAARPTLYGLEMHLASMHKLIKSVQPSTIVIDPVSNLVTVGTPAEVKALLMRLVDFLKLSGITALFTNLVTGQTDMEMTEIGVSSLMDTWLLVRDIESHGERNRGIYVIKSRGMSHSNQVREFLLTDRGIELQDVYVGPGGVLTGTARAVQEARERDEAAQQARELERRRREIEQRRRQREATIAALQAEAEAEERELQRLSEKSEHYREALAQRRDLIARMRHVDSDPAPEARQGGQK